MADVDGDGRPDLVFVTQPGPAIVPQRSLNVLLTKADASYTPMPTASLPTNTLYRCVAADVEGDGRTDIICPDFGAYSPSQLAMVTLFGSKDGNGSFRGPVTRSFTTQMRFTRPYRSVGRPERGRPGGSGDHRWQCVVSLAGRWHGPVSAAVISGGEGVVTVADVNGHGKPDFYNSGPYVVLTAEMAPLVADCNRDGFPDLFFANSSHLRSDQRLPALSCQVV